MIKLRQLIPNSVCLQCKICCRFLDKDSVFTPHLTHPDIQGLLKAGLSEQSLEGFRFNLVRAANLYLCPCLETATNKCKFYFLRPLECRLYPFLIAKKGKKTFLALDMKCPFLSEELLEKERPYLDYLIDFLESSPVKEAILNTPLFIGDYTNDNSVRYLREINLTNADDSAKR